MPWKFRSQQPRSQPAIVKATLFTILLFSCKALLYCKINMEDELKKAIRPFGYMAHELKDDVESIFRMPKNNYHHVKADTFFQKHVAAGRIGIHEMAAALPDKSALGRRIKIYYPATNKAVRCYVRDTGPWFVRDPYWKLQRGPLATRLEKTALGEKIDYRSGISLSPEVWYRLGVRREVAYRRGFRDTVAWRFIYDDDHDRSFRRGKQNLPPKYYHEGTHNQPCYYENRPYHPQYWYRGKDYWKH